MTPADLAAALGVDVGLAMATGFGELACMVGPVRWSVIPVPSNPSRRPSLRYSDPISQTKIAIPITTTLPAAVAHVRAMLAVPEPKP